MGRLFEQRVAEMDREEARQRVQRGAAVLLRLRDNQWTQKYYAVDKAGGNVGVGAGTAVRWCALGATMRADGHDAGQRLEESYRKLAGVNLAVANDGAANRKAAVAHMITAAAELFDPSHGAERNRALQTDVAESGASAVTATVCDRWCAFCRSWVHSWGVTGELQWMGKHRDGDCATPPEPSGVRPCAACPSKDEKEPG